MLNGDVFPSHEFPFLKNFRSIDFSGLHLDFTLEIYRKVEIYSPLFWKRMQPLLQKIGCNHLTSKNTHSPHQNPELLSCRASYSRPEMGSLPTINQPAELVAYFYSIYFWFENLSNNSKVALA